MTQDLDITGDACPLTHVKVGRAMGALAAGETLRVTLRADALKAVMSSLKAAGHRVTAAERRDGDLVVIEVLRA
jgi:TusA-related sulfurtransferase